MKQFKAEFFFTNIDNSLYTDERASVIIDLKADDMGTAGLLCEHLQRLYASDHYELKEVK